MLRPLLEVKDLRISFKAFEGEAFVLDAIDLTVQKEEVVAIVGETGCGKSCTLKAILGILPPAARISGEIIYEGKNLLEMSENDAWRIRGDEIGLIPQNIKESLNPTITVGEQLMNVIAFHGKRRIGLLKSFLGLSKSEMRGLRAEVIKILEDMMIYSPEKIMERYPFELSGGMQQRVLIAMNLVRNPKIVLADEPGTALDVSVYNTILQLLMDKIKERELSVIFVTHNLAVAKKISQRVCVMYAGNIVEIGKSEEIFENPMHPYTTGLINAIPKLGVDYIQGIRGHIPDYTSPLNGCRFHPRCDYAMDICRRRKPQLVPVGNRTVACHLFGGQ